LRQQNLSIAENLPQIDDVFLNVPSDLFSSHLGLNDIKKKEVVKRRLRRREPNLVIVERMG